MVLTKCSRWREKFPVSSHPVLALTGAPASFPVSEAHLDLQRSLEWTDLWRERGERWVETNMGRAGVRYLALHLRNGLDWVKACEHSQTGGPANLFSSAQCLGYNNQHGHLTRDLCPPSEQIIVKQMEQMIRYHGQIIQHITNNYYYQANQAGTCLRCLRQRSHDC